MLAFPVADQTDLHSGGGAIGHSSGEPAVVAWNAAGRIQQYQPAHLFRQCQQFTRLASK